MCGSSVLSSFQNQIKSFSDFHFCYKQTTLEVSTAKLLSNCTQCLCLIPKPVQPPSCVLENEVGLCLSVMSDKNLCQGLCSHCCSNIFCFKATLCNIC